MRNLTANDRHFSGFSTEESLSNIAREALGSRYLQIKWLTLSIENLDSNGWNFYVKFTLFYIHSFLLSISFVTVHDLIYYNLYFLLIRR